jgi:hypothetical protein
MSHTFLSLDNSKVPAETKLYVPGYSDLLSNDNSRILIDGYKLDINGKYERFTGDILGLNGELISVVNERVIAHLTLTFQMWLQWSENPQAIFDELLSTAIEYTKEQLVTERKDMNSIWHGV